MARMRTIKPGFFENDLLAEVDPLGRLLFAGLWTQADRRGRLEDRPKKLKAVILPYDSCDADALLDQLAQRGFIVRYEISGAKYIQVSNFSRHQSPHIKEIESVIPPPPDFTETSTEPEPEDEELENYQSDTSTVLAPDTPASPANVTPYEPRSNFNMYSNSNRGEARTCAQAPPSPSDPLDAFNDLNPQVSEIFSAICEVCVLGDPADLRPIKYREIKSVETVLRKKGAKAETVRGAAKRWYLTDWRGKRGDAPTPSQLVDEWTKLTTASQATGGGMAGDPACKDCRGFGFRQRRPGEDSPHKGVRCECVARRKGASDGQSSATAPVGH